jgi:PST family polysaccharide transporter
MPALPRRLNALLANRAAGNFAWLVADRGIRLVVTVFVSGWTARYLGPRNFGLLNYALSLSAVFASLAPLGMEGVAVRDIIWNRANAGSVIGTAIGLRSGCAILGALASVAIMAWLRPGDSVAPLLVALLGVGMVGQSLEYGELLFRADTRMSLLVIPRLGLFFCLSVIKVILVLRGLSVGWFAALTAFEQVCSGAITTVLLRRYAGQSLRLSFAWSRCVMLLKECWPLALAGVSIIIYMKSGQLLIGSLLGDRALGFYSAAIRVPESAYFIPLVLDASLLPGILARMREGRAAYEEAILRYMRISVCVALAICIPITLGAPLITRLLYSRQYASSAAVMAVYSWSLPFIFLGVARAQCLLNERKNALALVFSILGLISNLALNLMLIPVLGIMGAAISTVASQAFSSFVASWFISATRPVARHQLFALLTPWRVATSRRPPPAAPTCGQEAMGAAS